MGRLHQARGFTLIEMSIAMVIIGLIVGGVLVGRSLIAASGIRATITQIEKYNAAVNTFKGKYAYLPGDIKDPEASAFGFLARGSQPGQGNGDGVIAGFWNPASLTYGSVQTGEPTAFWVDLSSAHLIPGGFNTATPTALAAPGCTVSASTAPSLGNYFPTAALGFGSYVVAWSGGWSGTDGNNYFSVLAIPELYCYSLGYSIDYSGGAWTGPVPLGGGLSVAQAYSMDNKIDDGMPQSGRVLALFPYSDGSVWSGYDGGTSGVATAPFTTATAGSPSTCFDNGNMAGVTQQYSLEINSGSGTNCALSFRFQ
jgi:prepilin-type N-terminal cleavage/methylation domain-containing protein